MAPPVPTSEIEAERIASVETVTRWGLVALASIAAIGALLRMFGPTTTGLTQRLDQTTLLYLAVAGVLLLLKQIKTFSMGQLKFEMIEKLRERQDKQEERVADIQLILPLLLAEKESTLMKNLAARSTKGYEGTKEIRSQLRRLASIGLLERRDGRTIGDMKDLTDCDLADYVVLTDFGRRWAARILELEATRPQDA